jgi:hypothetical protein
MKISVITVALNPGSEFCLTAESILLQDHDQVEWVVIDGLGWSADNTYIDRYKDRIDTYVRSPDEGVYAAMNTAWTHATGDYIVFLNAGDVFYQADTLSRMVGHMGRGLDIVYGDHDYVDRGMHLFRRAGAADVILARLQAGDVEKGWHGMMPCHQATFYRRALFAEEQFDTRFAICADHDFFLRMAVQKRPMAHTGVVVCRYYGGGFSAKNAQRCRNEWSAIYSSFSRDPGRVVQHFGGEGAASADVTLIDTRAMALEGLFKWEGPYPDLNLPRFAWAREGGVTILVREDVARAKLTLTGRSQFVQRIEVMQGGNVIARKSVKAGPFTLVHDVEGPIAAGTTFVCTSEMADRLSPSDARVTGWSLISFTITDRP